MTVDDAGRTEFGLEEAVALAQNLANSGDSTGAIALCRQILAQVAPAQMTLGRFVMQSGDPRSGLVLLAAAAWIAPDDRDCQLSYCEALLMVGRFTEAQPIAEKAVAVEPLNPRAHHLVGLTLFNTSRHEEAIASFEEVVRIDPSYPRAWRHLGASLLFCGRLSEGIEALRTAIGVEPDDEEAWKNLAVGLQEFGVHAEARAVAERAPPSEALRTCLLLGACADETLDREAIIALHRARGAEIQAAAPPSPAAHTNSRDPSRRLRVGYVSGDFREHVVAFFLAPMLAAHDRDAVEVYAYSNYARPDAITTRFQQSVSAFRVVIGLTDQQLDDAIRADGIDVLVDLSGHTALNRLPVFARKPAPIQITYLGYPATTGVPAIDAYVTDAWVAPPGQCEADFVETLIRPSASFLAYRPPADAPPVSALPAPRRGRVTFGSFASAWKIGEGLIALWSEVLRAVPDSRMVMKNRAAGDSEWRTRLMGWFERCGVARERIEILPFQKSAADHLADFGEVDVALDSFPYHGTTTTCEALWMGVPVVTLAGTTHAQRVGVSLLSNVGLGELVATSRSDFVRIAVELAGDPARLAELRAGLRARVQRSPLLDAVGLARGLEATYRQLWRDYCARHDGAT